VADRLQRAGDPALARLQAEALATNQVQRAALADAFRAGASAWPEAIAMIAGRHRSAILPRSILVRHAAGDRRRRGFPAIASISGVISSTTGRSGGALSGSGGAV
jgi:hypothetical protein